MLSVEFLEGSGFEQIRFPDGLFWVRTYPHSYVLQVDETLTHFTEDDDGWVETGLSETDFIRLIELQQTHFCK